MTKKPYLPIALLALMLQLTGAAYAAVTLWDNGGPATAPNQGGNNMSSFNQAADFTTTFTTNLSSVTFWSLEGVSTVAPSYAGSIFYRIVGDIGGAPDDSTVLASGTATPTRTGAGTALGLNVMKNDFGIALNSLLAGTYWLELHNGALNVGSDDVEFYWSWSDLGAADNGSSSLDQERSLFPNDPTWGTNAAEHAFLIMGDRNVLPPPGIPEPATLLLTAIAMGSALFVSRRRRPV